MPTADYVAKLRRESPRRFPNCTFFFQPVEITSQILNFGLPAPINIQVGRGKRRRETRRRQETSQGAREDSRHRRSARSPEYRSADSAAGRRQDHGFGAGAFPSKRALQRAGIAELNQPDHAELLGQPSPSGQLRTGRPNAAGSDGFGRRDDEHADTQLSGRGESAKRSRRAGDWPGAAAASQQSRWPDPDGFGIGRKPLQRSAGIRGVRERSGSGPSGRRSTRRNAGGTARDSDEVIDAPSRIEPRARTKFRPRGEWRDAVQFRSRARPPSRSADLTTQPCNHPCEGRSWCGRAFHTSSRVTTSGNYFEKDVTGAANRGSCISGPDRICPWPIIWAATGRSSPSSRLERISFVLTNRTRTTPKEKHAHATNDSSTRLDVRHFFHRCGRRPSRGSLCPDKPCVGHPGDVPNLDANLRRLGAILLNGQPILDLRPERQL